MKTSILLSTLASILVFTPTPTIAVPTAETIAQAEATAQESIDRLNAYCRGQDYSWVQAACLQSMERGYMYGYDRLESPVNGWVAAEMEMVGRLHRRLDENAGYINPGEIHNIDLLLEIQN